VPPTRHVQHRDETGKRLHEELMGGEGPVPTYVAFLRAINLGGVRKVPMADLRAWLAEAGYHGVETHIQTGNVRLVSGRRSTAAVERDLEGLLAGRTGFEVPTVVVTPAELRDLHAAVRALIEELGVTAERRYVAFLKTAPSPEAAAAIDGWSAPGEGARVVGRHVFWWLDHSVTQAKLSNARLGAGGAVSTTRDLKVVDKLVEKWC
jgi:uncharacterized protein (DUF1697 family)